MPSLQIFEPAMCCSTGVCGPSVDPTLVRFAADLEWIKSQGISVERANLAQKPQAFVESELVRATLQAKGPEILPLVIIDGEIAFSSTYPSRAQLAERLGLPQTDCCEPNSGCCEPGSEELLPMAQPPGGKCC